jgi:hypothetical protein
MDISLTAAIAPIVGLIGVLIGARLNRGNERRRRQLDFIEKQLRELYSPLLGIRKQIRAYGGTRVRVQEATDAAWRELCNSAQAHGGPEELQRITKERQPAFHRAIDYDGEQFKNKLLPQYDEMLKIFRDHYMLAEPTTREHLPELVEYVELWHRHFDKTVPGEALAMLGVVEEKLHPLYDDIEQAFNKLRSKLAAGDPDDGHTWLQTLRRTVPKIG